MPYWIAIVSIIFMVAFAWYSSGDKNPLSVIKQISRGDSGFASTSKFQFFLWTLVIIFSYMFIWGIRAKDGDYSAIDEIPGSLMILMGISTGSVIGAKVVTSQLVARGNIRSVDKKVEQGWFKGIICDEDNELSLSKFQMIAWTFIAIAIYLVQIIKQINVDTPILPDVSDALLVLMGISQGAYIGTKLSTTTTTNLKSVGVDGQHPNYKISGSNFGENQAGSTIKIVENGQNTANKEFNPSVTTWAKEEIKFTLPSTVQSGDYKISLIIGGRESNQLSLGVS